MALSPSGPAVPSLTVRAFAELMNMSLYQLRAYLVDYKYPKKGQAPFRIPYYRSALGAIRSYYRSGNQAQALAHAIARISSSKLTPVCKAHNIRVVRAFQASSQARRRLVPQVLAPMSATFHGLTLRHSPELYATLGAQAKDVHILYNFRDQPITRDITVVTLELLHWLLGNTGHQLGSASLEFVDLTSRSRIYRLGNVRPRTLHRARVTAQGIVHLWPTI